MSECLGQNTPVRRIIAWTSGLALVLATLYAPFFHVHSDTAETPLVHAHLPEQEAFDDESVVHMEAPHSHATAKSIDFLTTVAGHFIHLDAALESVALTVVEPQPSRGFVPAASPRAHAPPSLKSLTPRAPPA